MVGLRVLLLSPEVSSRSCSDCQTYLYHDKGAGQFGKRVERGGKAVKRPKGTPTPCAWCPKIPPGERPVPANAVELSDKSTAAYAHYLECRAVGDFPRDAIVLRNAGLIRHAEDAAERVERAQVGFAVLSGISRRG